MRQKLKNLGYRLGWNLTRVPGETQIRDALKFLHPVNVDVPMIRLGGDGDGGYLLPDDLDGIEACFSPGVDVTASFERDLVARGIPCFLADASVPAAPITHDLIDFEKKFVGVTDGGDFISLDAWVERKLPGGHGDMLLQMDIEGAEWPVLLSMSDALLDSFRIIVLELHGLGALFDPFGISVIGPCLERLASKFHVIHVHPNNSLPLVGAGDLAVPYTIEVTLLRKDRAKVTGFATTFPHPLDVENVPGMPPLILPASLRH